MECPGLSLALSLRFMIYPCKSWAGKTAQAKQYGGMPESLARQGWVDGLLQRAA